MNRCFGYVRVSTVKQGEKGVSLTEQRSAIEQFAMRNGLTVIEWFEERETAAKQGRPIFDRMLRLVRKGAVEAVVVHKIDRSARNLRDWNELTEINDKGTAAVYFASEGLDLHSRGGRLTADIQAVVAADYIRNLRDEARKGFYGRLKQGIYPLGAPVGYLDTGGGKPKTVDPDRGPLVREAFELYATGRHSLRSLAAELGRRGLTARSGNPIRINSLSVVLNNPFYAGLIRIKKTQEAFEGKHEPLVSMRLFREVQEVLRGKVPTRAIKHDFLFRRLVRCAGCGSTLVGELQKGHTYYRCHQRDCAMTGVREEILEAAVRRTLRSLVFTEAEKRDFDLALKDLVNADTGTAERTKTALALRLSQIRDRLTRLTDALLDGLVEKDLFRDRKERLLMDRAETDEALQRPEADAVAVGGVVAGYFELASSASLTYETANRAEKRELLRTLTSNRTANRQEGFVGLSPPFSLIAERAGVSSSPLHRETPRTGRKSPKRQRASKSLVRQLFSWLRDHPEEMGAFQGTPAIGLGRDGQACLAEQDGRRFAA